MMQGHIIDQNIAKLYITVALCFSIAELSAFGDRSFFVVESRFVHCKMFKQCTWPLSTVPVAPPTPAVTIKNVSRDYQIQNH